MSDATYLHGTVIVIVGGVILFLYICLCLLLVGLAQYVITLPLRRAEKARLFLDLMELGIASGQSPEVTITRIAETDDKLLSREWRALSMHIKSGLSLGAALQKAPGVVSPEIAAMVETGGKLGDLRRVIAASRVILQDSLSQTRGALNYIILVTLAMTPVLVGIPLVLKHAVLPKFLEVFAVAGNAPLPAFSSFVLRHQQWIVCLQALAIGLLWLLVLTYAGGPRLRSWVHRLAPAWVDGLNMHLPWRRKRLVRNFTAMLSILLDSGVPEHEAILKAAECTANRLLMHRGHRAADRVAAGFKLPEALKEMDESGELHWRLANAGRSGQGFGRALSAWQDHLDAKAFQEEQAAAQVLSTGLVIYNGILVGGLSTAVFLGLIHLIDIAALW